ncbi:LUD domain-containing protein [Actinoplanes sp. NPDC026619]|uniref:LutC/YkgG family protein n=1 Tax=Actinoplanes sp. NPDC026619 TaxID=3155798 RepID=UPI003406FCE4
MSSKDVVLGRIRAALADGTPAPEIPRDYRRGPARVDLDLLVERLIDYKAVVHRLVPAEPEMGIEGSGPQVGPTVDKIDVTAAIRAAISDILPSGTVVVPPGLPAGWLPDGVEALVDDGLPADRIAATDGVVTASAVAVAETGTIVLDASPDQGRRIISLLPDLHICVLRTDQVVASVPEALERLDPTRPLTWISGPSATSDIELNRVEGVHGPRNLHIILLPA